MSLAFKSASLFLLSFFILLFVSPTFCTVAHAQSIPGITDPVTFQVSPQFPKPNTTVTISAQSYSTDLNRANFTWTVNGKVVKQGVGVLQITTSSGKAGIESTVSVDVVTTDIGTLSKTISWRPADVTLLWQSDGYTPPFYKGKALELYGSTFKVTAIPEFFTANGKRIDSKTLVYTWKKNGTVDAAQSGYGKDSYSAAQSSYVRGSDTIAVDVSNVDRSIGAVRSIDIAPGIADTVFYENSPLYGVIYERALPDTLSLTEEEISLRAEPYSISATNPLLGLVTFDWTINSSAVPDFKDKNEITLRSTGTVGQSNIGLSIQNQSKILQGGQAAITIIQ